MLQRVVSLLVALTLVLLVPCRAEAVSTSATSAILMDADSGKVLFEKKHFLLFMQFKEKTHEVNFLHYFFAGMLPIFVYCQHSGWLY